MENGANIILTPRPRRFGKTLNLNMLKYFFDIRTELDTKELFKEFVINNLSYFDVSGKEPERVYHAFVLGMLVSLSDKCEVK